MAVTNKGSSRAYSKKGSGGSSGSSNPIFIWTARIISIIFILMCLFGVINQLEAGKSFMNFLSETGQSLGSTVTYIFTGEQDTPLNLTDKGLYVDGYEPDGSRDISEVIKEKDEARQKENESNKEQTSPEGESTQE